MRGKGERRGRRVAREGGEEESKKGGRGGVRDTEREFNNDVILVLLM